MSEPWVNFLAVVFGGLITAIGAFLINRRKSKAETTQILADVAVGLIQPLKDEITELRGEVKELRARVATLETLNTELRKGVKLLTEQVRELGAEPVYKHDK